METAPHYLRRLVQLASARVLAAIAILASSVQAQVLPPDCPLIERQVPPMGLEIPLEKSTAWLAELRTLETQASSLDSPLQADVDVLLKACRYAVEFRELYQNTDFAKVDRLLKLATVRIQAIADGNPTWPAAAGRQIRGFRSRVDGSVQPIGLVLPDDWRDSKSPLPLYVWLHGRGDKSTDLHFLCERLDKDGQIRPAGAIVVHPFGRQCLGYKSAGETDVMEAIDFVCANYPIDRRRIVLMGFSMGGAGVWHLAAHYGERFVAASSGAGFAETARYQNLQPADYPPKYEQMLWSIYDVPGYTQSLFNLPFVAYSGELDKQIQAARVMEEAYAAEGRELPHLIGPGMGHKYHPGALAEILSRMAAAVEKGKPENPSELLIQTRHPRYSSRAWLTIDGPIAQYQDTRATARQASGGWEIQTKNVQRLRIDHALEHAPRGELTLDGTKFKIADKGQTLLTRTTAGKWLLTDGFAALRKQPKLSGPIDDAFIDPFLVVLPSGSSPHPKVERWVKCELANFQQRWATLFRGKLRMKLDSEVTPADLAEYHLILWGDAVSNTILRRVVQSTEATGSLGWSASGLTVGTDRYDVSNNVLLAIRPNPMAWDKYVVINSGPTFRQAHDRTNSLQNPHLPDWAVVSLAQPPTDRTPGKIVAAGFFDDNWQLDPSLTWRD